jgi:hypothetical protein
MHPMCREIAKRCVAAASSHALGRPPGDAARGARVVRRPSPIAPAVDVRTHRDGRRDGQRGRACGDLREIEPVSSRTVSGEA